MSRFEIEVTEAPSTETLLLPKDTKVEGTVTKVTVKAGISERTAKPWIQASLAVKCRGTDITEILQQDEAVFFYNPPVFLTERGGLAPNNETLAKFLELIDVGGESLRTAMVSSLRSSLMEGVEEAGSDVGQLQKYWNNVFSYTVGTELSCIIGQRDRDGRNPSLGLVNFVSSVSAV